MADVEKAAMTADMGGAEPSAPPQYAAQSYGTNANPPSYDDGQAPPSYDSIFGQVKAVKSESSGVVDFFKKFLVLILGTLGCTVFIAIFLAIPISMIAIGSIYIHDCPYERFIPIYLIVGGCFGIVKHLSNMGQRIRNKRENRDEENANTNPFDGVLNCFLLAWFIAGNVWIYRSFGRFSSDPTSADYCNYTLYWYAFWLTTASYIVAFVSCCCFCITGCVVSMFPWA